MRTNDPVTNTAKILELMNQLKTPPRYHWNQWSSYKLCQYIIGTNDPVTNTAKISLELMT
ncbi:hypothetical protein DPMN_028904 [Dreissena polymorpha]|uniref:Uncharacterized protein n=1 Tax=Dreissena polymorpha TaxID=45954 RepID=A0A9D4RGW6_DREPO|nr:hypothetical protein DPMN_028904 [Dreissena polymorpha]